MHHGLCPIFYAYEIGEWFCLLHLSMFGCFLFWIVVYNFYNLQFNKRHDLTASLAYENIFVIPHHSFIACCSSFVAYELGSELWARCIIHWALLNVHLTFTKLFDIVVLGEVSILKMFVIVEIFGILEIVSVLNDFRFNGKWN